MSWVHRCLIVPTDQVELARQISAALAGPSGDGMWITPLSPTGELPATHWISAGLISQSFADMLPLTIFPEDSDPITTPGTPLLVADLATANDYPTTSDDVQALFDASDVTEQDAFTAMARLGLVMASEPMEEKT